MKKYFIGFIVGVFLTLPFSVLAEEVSNVGKKIAAEFTVKLDGEKLPVKAIALDGTSYAPVRAVGEALGLDVDFQDGEVLLSKKVGDINSDILDKLEITNDVIRQFEEQIADMEMIISNMEERGYSDDSIQKSREELQRLKSFLAEHQETKEQLEKQLEDADNETTE